MTTIVEEVDDEEEDEEEEDFDSSDDESEQQSSSSTQRQNRGRDNKVEELNIPAFNPSLGKCLSLEILATIIDFVQPSEVLAVILKFCCTSKSVASLLLSDHAMNESNIWKHVSTRSIIRKIRMFRHALLSNIRFENLVLTVPHYDQLKNELFLDMMKTSTVVTFNDAVLAIPDLRLILNDDYNIKSLNFNSCTLLRLLHLMMQYWRYQT